jgi:sulfite dehydrogenase
MGGLRVWVLGVLAGGVVIGLGAAAYQMGIDEGEDRAQTGQAPARTAPEPDRAPAGPGKALFVSNCGRCHTLEAAGTDGQVGPNLDDLGPDAAAVLSAIRSGGTGSGAMPRNLVQGTQAQQVADYVAEATGG